MSAWRKDIEYLVVANNIHQGSHDRGLVSDVILGESTSLPRMNIGSLAIVISWLAIESLCEIYVLWVYQKC